MLTAAQLKMRSTGLGGSDIAAALGLSPWKSQLELWAEKSGGETPELDSKFVEWGTRLESAVYAKFWQNNQNLRVSHAGGTLKHETYPFLLATPDGFIVDEKNLGGILEIKTSSHRIWDEVPAHYLLQVQHYMYVTGRSFAYFAVLFRGVDYREYGPYQMDRDAYEQMILPQLERFWKAVTDKDPVFDPTSLADLSLIVDLDDEEEPIEANDDLRELIEEARSVASELKNVTGYLKDVKLKIAKAMGSCKRVVNDDGKTLVTQVEVADTTILDGKTLKEENLDMWIAYSKVKKGYRTLRVY